MPISRVPAQDKAIVRIGTGVQLHKWLVMQEYIIVVKVYLYGGLHQAILIFLCIEIIVTISLPFEKNAKTEVGGNESAPLPWMNAFTYER